MAHIEALLQRQTAAESQMLDELRTQNQALNDQLLQERAEFDQSLEQLQATNDALVRKLQDQLDRLEQNAVRDDTSRALSEQQTSRIEELEQQIDQLRDDARASIEEQESAVQAVRALLHQSEAEWATEKSALLEDQNRQVAESREELEQQLEPLRRELAVGREQVAELREQLQTAELAYQEEIQRHTRQEQQNISTIQLLQAECDSIAAQRADLLKEISQLISERDEYRDQIENLIVERDEADQINQARIEAAWSDKLAQVQEQFSAREQELQEQNEQLLQKIQELDELRYSPEAQQDALLQNQSLARDESPEEFADFPEVDTYEPDDPANDDMSEPPIACEAASECGPAYSVSPELDDREAVAENASEQEAGARELTQLIEPEPVDREPIARDVMEQEGGQRELTQLIEPEPVDRDAAADDAWDHVKWDAFDYQHESQQPPNLGEVVDADQPTLEYEQGEDQVQPVSDQPNGFGSSTVLVEEEWTTPSQTNSTFTEQLGAIASATPTRHLDGADESASWLQSFGADGEFGADIPADPSKQGEFSEEMPETPTVVQPSEKSSWEQLLTGDESDDDSSDGLLSDLQHNQVEPPDVRGEAGVVHAEDPGEFQLADSSDEVSGPRQDLPRPHGNEGEPANAEDDLIARLQAMIGETGSADNAEQSAAPSPAAAFDAADFDNRFRQADQTPLDTDSAKTAGAGGDEEVSIEDYMQQLMNRVSGGSYQAPATSSPQTQPPTPIQRVQYPDETQPVDRTPAMPPRREMQPIQNLQAMRELANESTRSAIDRHARRATESAVWAQLGTMCIAVLVAAILLILAQGRMTLLGFSGAVALIIGMFYGYRAFQSGAATMFAQRRDKQLTRVHDGDDDVDSSQLLAPHPDAAGPATNPTPLNNLVSESSDRHHPASPAATGAAYHMEEIQSHQGIQQPVG